MAVEFVDADAHVVEGQALIGECLRRWPDAFSFTEKGELITEGRRYPEPEETVLPAVAAALGPDFIMYASDYPHWDTDWPDSTRPLRGRADLSEDVRAKIAGGNARRFYGLR
jgi:hypothetical protein